VGRLRLAVSGWSAGRGFRGPPGERGFGVPRLQPQLPYSYSDRCDADERPVHPRSRRCSTGKGRGYRSAACARKHEPCTSAGAAEATDRDARHRDVAHR